MQVAHFEALLLIFLATIALIFVVLIAVSVSRRKRYEALSIFWGLLIGLPGGALVFTFAVFPILAVLGLMAQKGGPLEGRMPDPFSSFAPLVMLITWPGVMLLACGVGLSHGRKLEKIVKTLEPSSRSVYEKRFRIAFFLALLVFLAEIILGLAFYKKASALSEKAKSLEKPTVRLVN